MQFFKSGWLWQVLLLISILVACSLPLFASQMFFTHDFIHGVRIAEMTKALHDGHFPVRWSSNFAYGYGMPLFEFYAPFPFYIGSVLYLLGVPLIASVKSIFGLANIFTILGAYLLGRKLGGKWIGVLTAALIALAPYRAVNLYIRGAISEVWGITALVWVLYSTILVLEKRKYSQFLLIASLVALFLSHNLTTMIAAPFIAVWTIGVFVYTRWAEFKDGAKVFTAALGDIWRFIVSYLVAVGVSAFYLFPAFVEKDFTKVEAATTGGYFDYHLHFLYIRQFLRPGWGYGGSEWGPDDKLSFFLGYGQVVGLLLAGLALVWVFFNWRKLEKSKRSESMRTVWLLGVSGLIMLGALGMSIGKATPIWEAVEFLKYVQFPWRFYSVVLVFVGVVVALGGKLLTQHLNEKLLKVVALVVVALTIGINAQYFRPEKYLEDGQALYYDDSYRTREHMSGILPDYIPKSVPKDPPVSYSLINCSQFSVCGNVQVITDKTQQKVVQISMLNTQVVTIDIANYPGWQAFVDDSEVEVKTSAEGLVAVQLPAGEHKLELLFANSPVRWWSDLISVVSIVVFIVWATYIWIKDDFMDDWAANLTVELEQTPAGTTQSPETEEEEAATVAAIKSKSVNGAASYFGRTILLNVVGLGSALLLSKFLRPEDFGLYGLVTQVIGILIFFSDIGLAAALVQKKEEPSTQDYATVFTVQQILSWVIVVICGVIIGSGVLSEKLGTTGNWILLALAISFPLAALKTIPSIILERKLDFAKLVVPSIVEQLSFHAVLIYFAWSGYGAIAYVYAITIRSVLGVAVLYKIAPWKISLGVTKASLSTLLNFGAKFQLNDALARVKDQLFFMVIGLYFPLNQFGFIQWSKNWSLYPYNLTVQNVMAITFPTFSRLQHNKMLLKKAIEKSLFFISLLIFPVIVGMVVFIYPMVELSPGYHKWLPALPSFILFTISVLFSAVSSPLTNALNAVGKINQTLRLMVLWTVLTWIITPICIFIYGFTGVSVAALLIGFTSILPVWYIQKIVPVAVWEQVKLPVIASLVMIGAGLGLQQVLPLNWLLLLLIMVISGLAYVCSLFVFGRKRMETEIFPLVALIKRKL